MFIRITLLLAITLTADKLGGREMKITPIYCDASEVVNISSFNCATIGRNYI